MGLSIGSLGKRRRCLVRFFVQTSSSNLICILREYVESDDTPMSLKATAKVLGVSIGYLEYRFPAQVRLIVDGHQSYLGQDHMRKVYLAQTQALQYFLDISEN